MTIRSSSEPTEISIGPINAMTYILHNHDDTHDKPDRLDEELAHLLICSSLTPSVCAS